MENANLGGEIRTKNLVIETMITPDTCYHCLCLRICPLLSRSTNLSPSVSVYESVPFCLCLRVCPLLSLSMSLSPLALSTYLSPYMSLSACMSQSSRQTTVHLYP